MLTVQIDANEIKKMAHQKIAEIVKIVDAEYVYWDSAELKKRTCMSMETIQATFFYDSRFPKYKIGGKWYYPARETRVFLEQWILEQG